MRLIITIFISLVLISYIPLRPKGAPDGRKYFAVTYTWRYYSKALATGNTGWYLVGMPSDSATNTNKRMVFCFEPGTGETGDGNLTEANAAKYGYARDLKLGLWDGGILQSDGYNDSIVYPIIIVAQSSGVQTSTVSISRTRWDAVLGDYPLRDTNQIHFGGLSLGGRNILYLASNVGSSAGDPYRFAHSPVTMFVASPGGKSTNITDNAYYMGQYARKGGKFGISTGAGDNGSQVYFANNIKPYFNDTIPGSAFGEDWVTGVNGFTADGHCCWDTLFKFNRTYPWAGGKTIYEWQAQYTKTPKAIAQSVVNATSATVTLNGVSNGWYRTRAWTQVSGPAATINSPSSDTTSINLTGGAGDYVFRLTVTNTGDGRTATHDVAVYRAPTVGTYIIKKRGRKLVPYN